MFIPKRCRRSARLRYLDESRRADDSRSNPGLSAGGLLFTVLFFFVWSYHKHFATFRHSLVKKKKTLSRFIMLQHHL